MLTCRGISECFRTANDAFSARKGHGSMVEHRSPKPRMRVRFLLPLPQNLGWALAIKYKKELVRFMKKLLGFIRGVRAEWFKIVWPTRAEVVRATIMIIVFSVLAALFFFVVDSILNALVGWVF